MRREEHPDRARERSDAAGEDRLLREEAEERAARHSSAPPAPFRCAMPSAVPPRPRCTTQCAHCRRRGQFDGMNRLGPGFYDDGDGQLHIDIVEFVLAAGGDPSNPADVAKALEQVRKVAAEQGIPTETREL